MWIFLTKKQIVLKKVDLSDKETKPTKKKFTWHNI